MSHAVAMRLGRAYIIGETLFLPHDDNDDDVVKPCDPMVSRLTAFAKYFETAHESDASVRLLCLLLLKECRKDGDVGAFCMGRVMDSILLRLMNDCEALVGSTEVHQWLTYALDMDCVRTALGISPLLIDAIVSGYANGRASPILTLLVRVAACNEARMTIADARLFAACARLESRTERALAHSIVIKGAYYTVPYIVDELVLCALRDIARGTQLMEPHCTIDFVATCLNWSSQLRARCLVSVVELSRTGWPIKMGRIVAAQLDTPSVEYVVRLERRGALEVLIATAHDDARCDVPEWAAVRRLLAHAWPHRVKTVMKKRNPGGVQIVKAPPTTTGDTFTCPITHVPMTHPVVASDGHTYERDAIIRHMATRGAWSPITRETITYNLHANRTLMMLQ